MNNTTSPVKRSYHHSEAWLKKHTEKLTAKKDMKKLAQKLEKKPTVKESPAKLTMKNAVNVFNFNKKHVGALKKSMKEISKFLTEAFKTGDDKYVAKVLKLFERIGFTCDLESGVLMFKVDSKVKLPTVKIPKQPTVEKVTDASDIEVMTSKMPSVLAAPKIPMVDDVLDADTDENEELDDADDGIEFELSEKRDDETDEEFLDRMTEEREIAREHLEAEDETRDEIFAAQEENGDFS